MTGQERIKKLEACVESFRRELAKLRVGRANVSLVEDIPVSAYENTLPLKEVASISAPEARSLLIAPWDKSLVQAIEKAIRDSNLGLDPVVDGERVRVTVPALTEERRGDLVKILNQEAEKVRVCIRQVREDAMQDIDNQEVKGEISEDDKFREREGTQEDVDAHNKIIEEIRANKEGDITIL